MGRGPGPAQRSLLAVTEGGLVATTRAVLLQRHPQPRRSDYVTMSGATRALAEQGRIQAFYMRACPRCGEARRECCGPLRPLLSVAPPGMRLTYAVAPPPGRPAPPWVSAASGPMPGPLGRSPAPGDRAGAMLDQVIELGLERLLSGQMKMTPAALVSALALQARRDRDRDPGRTEEQMFARELLDHARRWMGREGYALFVTEVEAGYERHRRIREDRGTQMKPVTADRHLVEYMRLIALGAA